MVDIEANLISIPLEIWVIKRFISVILFLGYPFIPRHIDNW